ncbi:MAG: 4-hydroxy-tetrahydrodipicolinate reductase [Pseudomonadota bacterium]
MEVKKDTPPQPLRIGLLGFGKTGRLAALEVLKDKSLALVWVLRRHVEEPGQYASRLTGEPGDRGEILPAALAQDPQFWQAPERRVDVLVDFSSPEASLLYAPAAAAGVRIVSAVSHYDAPYQAILQDASALTALLQSPNITVGINFLMVAARVMQDFAPHADIEVIEEHFKAKRGVSGTALRLATVLGLSRRHVKSVRAGGIIGRHEVVFGLANQTVRMTHESISRAAFGRGALLAAKWIADKPPGRYDMESIVRESMARTLLQQTA